MVMLKKDQETYHGNHCKMNANVKSLCSPTETNIMLYISYISIKNKERSRLVNLPTRPLIFSSSLPKDLMHLCVLSWF